MELNPSPPLFELIDLFHFSLSFTSTHEEPLKMFTFRCYLGPRLLCVRLVARKAWFETPVQNEILFQRYTFW